MVRKAVIRVKDDDELVQDLLESEWKAFCVEKCSSPPPTKDSFYWMTAKRFFERGWKLRRREEKVVSGKEILFMDSWGNCKDKIINLK